MRRHVTADLDHDLAVTSQGNRAYVAVPALSVHPRSDCAAEARDLAKKSLQAEQRKYELGAETIFFVLDAQNTLEQAEQSYVQAQISYKVALAALDHATGTLLENNRVLISDSVR